MSSNRSDLYRLVPSTLYIKPYQTNHNALLIQLGCMVSFNLSDKTQVYVYIKYSSRCLSDDAVMHSDIHM